MAELAASVTGLAAFGAKLSLSLYEFASVIGSARSEVLSIGQELSLSSAVIQQLRSALDSDNAVYFSATALQTTKEIVQKCSEIFNEIQDVLDNAKKGDAMSAGQRVAWAFRRAKVKRLQGSLDTTKTTLQVMLATLQLSSKIYSRRNSSVSLAETVDDESEDAIVCQSLIVTHQISLENLEVLEQREAEEEKHSSVPSRKPLPPTPPTPKTGDSPSSGATTSNVEEKPETSSHFLTRSTSRCRLSRSSSMESLVAEAREQPYALAGMWTQDSTNRARNPLKSNEKSSPAPEKAKTTPWSVIREQQMVAIRNRSVSTPVPVSNPAPASSPTQDAAAQSESTIREQASTSSPQSKDKIEATPPVNSSQQKQTKNSFPHAFQRWETLSAHWEGLTSYWVKKLELNQTQLESLPLAMKLAKQVTDLSAAGANLFHAVVELQRLRASSERKFQRWFFETRAELERAHEVNQLLEASVSQKAQIQRTLQTELDETRVRLNSSLENLSARAQDFERKQVECEELGLALRKARSATDDANSALEDERRPRTTVIEFLNSANSSQNSLRP